MMHCCDEYGCTRKQPILLRPDTWIPDKWYVITKYRRVPQEGCPDLIIASQKHELDEKTCAALTAWRDALNQEKGVTPQEQVTEFHEAFGVAINAPWTSEMIELRITLLREELEEFIAALRARDPVAVAQEGADMEYVLRGTTISLGIDLDAAVTEVHRANMSKLGADGKPILRDDGKVLKGPNYVPPDMTKAINGSVREVT